MLETRETHTEYTEQAMMHDGTLARLSDAKITMKSLYECTTKQASFAELDRLFVLRSWADDLQGLIEQEAESADWHLLENKKIGINEILMSNIFEVDAPDVKWSVPPHTALAVLRNMVGINLEDYGELWLQEPFRDTDLLQQVWAELPGQR